MKTLIKVDEITKLSNPEETVDKRTTYLMTRNHSMTSIKDVEDGTQLDITHVCRFTDTNKDGNIVEIETYLDVNGNVYATQSATFTASCEDIRSIFAGEDVSIIKKSGKTNAGRDYVYCTLA